MKSPVEYKLVLFNQVLKNKICFYTNTDGIFILQTEPLLFALNVSEVVDRSLQICPLHANLCLSKLLRCSLRKTVFVYFSKL